MVEIEEEHSRFAALLRLLSSRHREQVAPAPRRPDLSPAVQSFFQAIGSSELAAPYVPAADAESDRRTLEAALATWSEHVRGRPHWALDPKHACLAGRVRLVDSRPGSVLCVDDDRDELFAVDPAAPVRKPVAVPHLQYLAHRLVTRATLGTAAALDGEHRPTTPPFPTLLPQLGVVGDGLWLLDSNRPSPLGVRMGTTLVFASLTHYVKWVSGLREDERGPYAAPWGTAIEAQVPARLHLDPRGKKLAPSLLRYVGTSRTGPKPPLNVHALGTIEGETVWIRPRAEKSEVRVLCEPTARDRLVQWLTAQGAEILELPVHTRSLSPPW